MNLPQLRKINYRGWPNCYRLSNDRVELIATTDVGPRIIRFGFVDGANEFAEFEADMGQVGGETWRVYGGHRLWHAPEQAERTYQPDNAPVAAEVLGRSLRLIQATEAATGIQKEIEVRLEPGLNQATLTHRLRNNGLWPVELAPWALSVMAPGGVAIVPLPARGSHPEDLTPVNSLIFWRYTDLSDPRWTWGQKFVLLRQQAGTAPQKFGISPPHAWLAYCRDGHLFVKRYSTMAGARYSGLGSAAEVFTNSDMLELESLGPLAKLAPGETIEHEERWFLFQGVPTPAGDGDVEAHILPLVNR